MHHAVIYNWDVCLAYLESVNIKTTNVLSQLTNAYLNYTRWDFAAHWSVDKTIN